MRHFLAIGSGESIPSVLVKGMLNKMRLTQTTTLSVPIAIQILAHFFGPISHESIIQPIRMATIRETEACPQDKVLLAIHKAYREGFREEVSFELSPV